MQHGGVGREAGIPADGEAHQGKGDKLRIVEGKDGQHQNWRVQKRQISQRIKEERSVFHCAALAIARAVATNSHAITATSAMLTMASAAPSGQLPTPLNCASMALAIIIPLVPPTSSGVTKSPVVGTKIRMAAPITPGIDSGRVMRRKRRNPPSPRSFAASSNAGSIFSSDT